MRWGWIEPDHPALPLATQCELLGLNRSTWYDRAAEPSALNLTLMRRLDEEYTAHPFYGSRRMTAVLRRSGHAVNRKRVMRLMRQMGLAAIYPKPVLSHADPDHRVYPYLLRGVPVTGPDHVWSTDITYIRLLGGFVYLAAILDGSRKEKGVGYWACAAVACESGGHRILPLHLRLWSCRSPEFRSENEEIREVISVVQAATKKRGSPDFRKTLHVGSSRPAALITR